MNDFFDAVYCLNLDKRPERMRTMRKRLAFAGIEAERFCALNGSVFAPLWKGLDNKHFSSPSYVACTLSHLSIYQQALDRGQTQILVLEDDIRVHRKAQEIFEKRAKNLPDEWDLIHLSYIPLSDNQQHWTYNILDDTQKAEPGFYKSKNMWSLMAYGISERLMRHLLQVYNDSFPMELDRYFVSNIMHDPNFVCRAPYPQLFCAEDNLSDNTGVYTPGLLQKSVDTRISKYHDFV